MSQSIGDLISRQALDEIKELMTDINGDTVYAVKMSDIRHLSSVNPQEPKTGYWIWKDFDEDTGISKSYWCSECNKPLTGLAMTYCGCCGAKMEGSGVKNDIRKWGIA